MKLLELLKKQRECFTKTVNGEKIIHNHIMHDAIEIELEKEQNRIGRENKKNIITECEEKNWSIPNFNEECI